MTTGAPRPFSIAAELAKLTFLPDRTPVTSDDDAGDAFGLVSDYRDGGVFVAHWAGCSEWERHRAGDEIVMVFGGRTTIFFLTDDGEHAAPLGAGDMVVVPQGTWHRFETPDAVQLLSVTPQPTDHNAERPQLQ
jgi:uncharacterized cupin superfamily protein